MLVTTPASLDAACATLEAAGCAPDDLRTRLETGAALAALAQTDDGCAVIIAGGQGAWRPIEVAVGPEAGLLVALEHLRGVSEALIWDEGTLALAPATLDALGYRLLERQAFTQELARVPLGAADAVGLALAVMDPTNQPQARALFARTHALSVEGLYVTLPEAPTPEACEASFDDYLGGAQGQIISSACLVALNQNQPVGVVCCVEAEEAGTALLLVLCVDAAARGQGVSRALVRGAQRALLANGYKRLLFLTTDRNTPVHHLFVPDELVATERFPTRLWLRQTFPRK